MITIINVLNERGIVESRAYPSDDAYLSLHLENVYKSRVSLLLSALITNYDRVPQIPANFGHCEIAQLATKTIILSSRAHSPPRGQK